MITCAVMHGVFVAYVNDGRYDLDSHGVVIDTVGPGGGVLPVGHLGAPPGQPARLERGR